MTETHEEVSTRKEIISLLRVDGPLSVAELGGRLGITHVAVRRHLTALERDGLVTSKQERLPMGRPTRKYELTDMADELFPKKYGTLSLEMIDFLAAADPEHKLIDQFFAARRGRLVDRYSAHVGETPDLSDRVSRLTEVQTADGYLAQWEAGPDGAFELKEFNCPVHVISRKYPYACIHELEFFKSVLGTDDVQRIECIAKGGNCCRYVIKPSDGASDTL